MATRSARLARSVSDPENRAHAEEPAAVADLDLVGLGVDLEVVVLVVGELGEQVGAADAEPGADDCDDAVAEPLSSSPSRIRWRASTRRVRQPRVLRLGVDQLGGGDLGRGAGAGCRR